MLYTNFSFYRLIDIERATIEATDRLHRRRRRRRRSQDTLPASVLGRVSTLDEVSWPTS